VNPLTGSQYEAWIYPENSPWGPVQGTALLQVLKYSDWLDYTNVGNDIHLPALGTNAHNLKLTFQGANIAISLDGANVANFVDNGNVDGHPAYTNGTVGLNMYSSSPVVYRMGVSNLTVSGLVSTNLAPFQITSITATNSVAIITWQSVFGQNYRLLYKTNIYDTNWIMAPNSIPAFGPSSSTTDILDPTNSRFYWIENVGTNGP
jgi:hypothetical protein